jgi:hypothetical protein
MKRSVCDQYSKIVIMPNFQVIWIRMRQFNNVISFSISPPSLSFSLFPSSLSLSLYLSRTYSFSFQGVLL